MTRAGIGWVKNALIVTTLMLLSFAASAFAQTGNAQLGGTVSDPSNALIPGVTVKATNVDTNISQNTVSNESGAYSFPVLQPGKYKVTADLPGFKQAVYSDVVLPYAGQIRLNVTLQIGTTSTVVEVNASASSVIRDSSASVGDVLSRQQIQSLPLIGNNVLDLLATLPGFRENTSDLNETGGGTANTVNGLTMDSVNATRDGISVNDMRNSTGTYGMNSLSTTVILPELVGEIRMILSPVDAEMGRGNSQLQIATRSGTNQYTGSASWNVLNSALNANTWDNNHTPFTDPFSGERKTYTPKTWNNRHQWTVAYGGPIKIPGVYDGKNKTFFYGVLSQNIRATREQVTGATALTATARQGIYRYWSGYNPVGWNPAAALATAVYPMTATTASLISVNDLGVPVRPVAAPTSPTGNPTAAGFIPYSGALTCFSVFGTQKLNPSGGGGMVPFTAADCPGGQAVLPTGRSAWDNFRPGADTSGLIAKFLKAQPLPNYFGSGDGLNYGEVRWIRGRKGTSNTTTALGGTDVNANITQYNMKVDHNLSSNHKVAASWTYQRDLSAVSPPLYPDGYFGVTTRRPHTLAINGTSTLGPRMVNEARYGLTYTLNKQAPPWEHPDETIKSAARDLMLPAGTNARSGNEYLALVNSGSGSVATANGFMGTTLFTNYQRSMRHTVADTLSWSTGKHAFKFGVDYRLTSTAGNGGSQAYPTVSIGNASASATPSPFATTATFNTATDSVGFLPGLLNASASGAPIARSNVTSLMYYLSGSVSAISHPYWITSPSNVTDGNWEDIATQGERIRKQKSQEIALFAKDDFKVTRRLTLNLGLRWDFFGSPYFEGGITSIFKDGYGAFGATRSGGGSIDQFNSDPFSYFLRPGSLYLTGYGSNPGVPLNCQNGVKQNALLPTSTCNPDSLSSVIFVGPGSPNPKQRAIPATYGNFGPAIGFAYQVPWFGEGKTTIRGGYQQTFGSAGGNRGTIGGGTEASLGNAPGVITQGTLTSHINDTVYQNILATRAITLSDIKSLVPMGPDQKVPGGALTPYGLSAGPQALLGWSVYDPNLKATYTQNITLSVTRAVSNKVTVETRYTGTLGRRLLGTLDINQNNVYHNPELFQALTDARAGTCTAGAAAYKANYTDKGINPCDVNGDPVLLDQLLAGLNLNVGATGAAAGSGTYGAVGTVNSSGIFQSGAQQMRRSATFQSGLSFGTFSSVADALVALAPSTAQGRQNLPINPATGVTLTGVGQTGLRNGCDRIANGFTMVQQTAAGGPQVANSGTAIPLRCFAEDFIHANPQFGITIGNPSVAYRTNTGRSSYNSLQTQVTLRPTAGFSGTATWVWAKSFNLPGSGYINPADRNLDFGVQGLNAHSLRLNGTVELPIGPNKLFLGNSSGLVARVLERWQASFIYNASSSQYSTLNPGQSHFYAVSRYDVASPNWVLPKSTPTWVEGSTTGSVFPNAFIGVPDPSCSNPAIVTLGDKMGTVLGLIPANPTTGAAASGPCSIIAIASRNPDGTAGEILLKYPEPGKVGTLGKSNIQGLGDWRFDVSLSKSFRFTESKSGQIRFDATNVLNHPNLDTPSLSGATLGTIAGKGNNVRTVQGSLRLTF